MTKGASPDPLNIQNPMRTWLFQANPDEFDLDGYLVSVHGAITWYIGQHATEIRPGDQVFIWRAIGSGKRELSGVVAEATVNSEVKVMPDEPAARQFWKDQSEAGKPSPRVWLDLVRVANKKQILRREWLEDDPVLSGSRIFRVRTGTNFSLTEPEVRRLRDLWSRTGIDFTRSESVAALWAYHKTYGKKVSRKPGSPVDVVARKTGRAIPGIYNKIMNFRSLDPRDARDGLSGAGRGDRAVWDEFFDKTSNRLRAGVLEQEYGRLWGDEAVAGGDSAAIAEALDVEVKRLEKTPLNKLLDAYRRSISTKTSTRPAASRTTSTTYARNPLVVAIAKLRAKYRCEMPGCKYEHFETREGEHYCEVHHLTPLASGGEDTIENVACLCPGHHRELHHGVAADRLKDAIAAIRSEE